MSSRRRLSLRVLRAAVLSCWVLFRSNILSPVVRETAKVTSMVFTILIGSQLLNLVLISFGGEHHIQQFLRSFDNEMVVFLVVMAILFVLGFVLDFLEIIYIVIPIVGPVIYGGTLDPKWVTIMIAVNLQTSFLTPPFGFALFYLRGVAPPQVTTGRYLSRGAALRGDPGAGAVASVAVPGHRDDPAGPAGLTRPDDRELRKGPFAAPFSWNGSGSCNQVPAVAPRIGPLRNAAIGFIARGFEKPAARRRDPGRVGRRSRPSRGKSHPVPGLLSKRPYACPSSAVRAPAPCRHPVAPR
jgi:fumarate reductase subunit C